jgi:hypothetical protein
MGSNTFIGKVKSLLVARAIERDVLEGEKEFYLGEGAVPYQPLFEAENEDIGSKNTFSGTLTLNNQQVVLAPTPDPENTRGFLIH